MSVPHEVRGVGPAFAPWRRRCSGLGRGGRGRFHCDTFDSSRGDGRTGFNPVASRDFTPVHHEKAAAQAAGLPDFFMNILTSNGLMGRFVTDWTGPEAALKSIEVKLGAPNVPGMVMTITGEVTAMDDAAGTVIVSVSGDNNVWGTHMAGKVCVTLPKES